MSWILGNKGSSNHGKRLDSKNRQVASLYQYFPNAIELDKLHAYRVNLQTSQDSGVSCVVILPPLYPDEPPKLLMEANIEHPWLTLNQNEIIVTGHSSLQPNVPWDPFYPLGNFVREVELEFRMRPPQVPFIRKADFPRFAMPDLTDLSADRIENLLKDEDAFREYLQTLPAVEKFKNIQADLQIELEKLANDNLEVNKSLEDAKESLSKREDALGTAVMDYSTKFTEQEAFLQKHGPEAMKYQLSSLLKKDDQTSEDILSDFHDQSIDVDTFLSKYKDARISFHLRSIKLEKLKTHPVFAESSKAK